MRIKKVCVLITITFLMTGFSTVSVVGLKINDLKINGDIIEVSPGESIQDAIDSADEGCTILVLNGIYNENINIDKKLAVQGEDKENTIIIGEVVIEAQNVNFKNFKIKEYGINVNNGKDSLIEENIICDISSSSGYGILISCNDVVFKNNLITNLTGEARYGIKLTGVGCTVKNNIITDFDVDDFIFGLYDWKYNRNTGNSIDGNTFQNMYSKDDIVVIAPGDYSCVSGNIINNINGQCLDGIILMDEYIDVIENELSNFNGKYSNHGINVLEANQNIVRNTIDIGSPKGYVMGIEVSMGGLINIEGNNIRVSKGEGFVCGISRNITIKDNYIKNIGTGGKGMELSFRPSEITIEGNTIDNFEIGIEIEDGYKNIIKENTIKNCKKYGLLFQEMFDYTLIGDSLAGATYNTINNNNFLSNEIDAVFNFSHFLRETEYYRPNNYPDSFNAEKVNTNNWDGNYWGPDVENPKEIPGYLNVYRASMHVGDNELIAYDNNPLYEPFGDNRAPLQPTTPVGEQNGNVRVNYRYTTSTIDLDGDEVYYFFDWGDGSNSGWVGPAESGVTFEQDHKYSKSGDYEIRVKAKDTNDLESLWSESLEVSMPKFKIFNSHPLLYLIINFIGRFFTL